jgi:hypothetical protein
MTIPQNSTHLNFKLYKKYYSLPLIRDLAILLLCLRKKKSMFLKTKNIFKNLVRKKNLLVHQKLHYHIQFQQKQNKHQ